MKKLCLAVIACMHVHLYAQTNKEQDYVFPVTGQTVSFHLDNQTQQDYIVVGDFAEKAVMLKHGSKVGLHYVYNVDKQGPRILLIRPNDLILYAHDSEYVEKELQATKLHPEHLAAELNAHIQSHGYYILESGRNVRHQAYHAYPGDTVVMYKHGGIVVTRAASNFPHKLFLKKVNKF